MGSSAPSIDQGVLPEAAAPSRGYAIETRGLRKVFGSKVAVRGLSLAVHRGEIFGFLGPNGAGKSTSIKMLLGLVKPSGGEAFVLGAPAGDVEARRKIGFLPETFSFYPWMTPAELLRLHGGLCGLSPAQLRARIPEMIELVGLTPHRDKQLQNYSKGMMQRAGLAQALIHEPDIIFLDEPTSGLDPMGRRLVRDIVRAQRDRGATIFLNSHILSEIEITCDRVGFIQQGEVVASHDLRTLNQGAMRVHATVRGLTPAALAGLQQWGTGADLDGDRLRFEANNEDALPHILRHLVSSGADVVAFTPQRISLEEMFVELMGEDRGL